MQETGFVSVVSRQRPPRDELLPSYALMPTMCLLGISPDNDMHIIGLLSHFFNNIYLSDVHDLSVSWQR